MEEDGGRGEAAGEAMVAPPTADEIFESDIPYLEAVYGTPDHPWDDEGILREKCAWENKDNDLFVCMTINDVVKHCLEKFGLQTAQNIWGWKTNSARKYWRCFECNKRFPDQESHMLHLESDHDLGISWDQEWLVPSQVQQESQSGVSEGVEERTHSLDDSITVDCTYRRFIVEMEKFGSLYQKEEEGNVQNVNEFWQIVGQIRQQIHCLVDMLDPKIKRCFTSEVVVPLLPFSFLQLKSTTVQSLSH